MCVCVYKCVYVSECVCVYECVYMSVCVCVCVRTYECVCVRACVCDYLLRLNEGMETLVQTRTHQLYVYQ